MATGDRWIVEKSYRDGYWGMQPQQDGTLVGVNALGQLLTQLKVCIRAHPETDLATGIENFLDPFNGFIGVHRFTINGKIVEWPRPKKTTAPAVAPQATRATADTAPAQRTPQTAPGRQPQPAPATMAAAPQPRVGAGNPLRAPRPRVGTDVNPGVNPGQAQEK